MFVRIMLISLVLGGMLYCHAADEEVEIRPLSAMLSPANWIATESSVAVSSLQLNGKPCLQWSVPIDHTAGEPKYPIGWPRVMFKAAVVDASWYLYDRFEMQVRVESSRPEAGPVPVSLTFYVKEAKDGHSLQLKLPPGEWQPIVLPMAALPEPAVLTGVRAAISESSFQHGDRLEFYFADARLLRSADCVLAKMVVASAVRRDGRMMLPVTTSMSGPVSDVPRGVPFRVARRSEVLRQEVLPVIRGERSWLMDISELHLPAGEYELTAFPGRPAKELQAVFTVEP